MPLVETLFPLLTEQDNLQHAFHGEYNLWIVIASIAIAIFASFTAFHLARYLVNVSQ